MNATAGQAEGRNLADRFGIEPGMVVMEMGYDDDVDEEDVDSVGGLMAKHLGLVPIPGSQVVAHGLRFTAEDTAGRRNKVGTVRIVRVEPGPEPEAVQEAAARD